MKYKVTFTAEMDVDAENVVQAWRAAEKLKVVGAGYGGGFPGPHDRDSIRCIREIVASSFTVERRE